MQKCKTEREIRLMTRSVWKLFLYTEMCFNKKENYICTFRTSRITCSLIIIVFLVNDILVYSALIQTKFISHYSDSEGSILLTPDIFIQIDNLLKKYYGIDPDHPINDSLFKFKTPLLKMLLGALPKFSRYPRWTE